MNASITYYADSLIVTLHKGYSSYIHHTFIDLQQSTKFTASIINNQPNFPLAFLKVVPSLHFDIQINGSNMQYWKEELMEWKRSW